MKFTSRHTKLHVTAICHMELAPKCSLETRSINYDEPDKMTTMLDCLPLSNLYNSGYYGNWADMMTLLYSL